MEETRKKLAIKMEKNPDPKKLQARGVLKWDIWTKEASTFDWHYSEKEVCYFLEGKVTVKSPYEEVSFGKGDLVTFPQGLSCTWIIHEKVKKHYQFG